MNKSRALLMTLNNSDSLSQSRKPSYNLKVWKKVKRKRNIKMMGSFKNEWSSLKPSDTKKVAEINLPWHSSPKSLKGKPSSINIKILVVIASCIPIRLQFSNSKISFTNNAHKNSIEWKIIINNTWYNFIDLSNFVFSATKFFALPISLQLCQFILYFSQTYIV